MRPMDTPQTDPTRTDPTPSALDDVDALIEELETQFEDSRLLPTMAPTGSASCHCTNAKGCTGTCPCAK